MVQTKYHMSSRLFGFPALFSTLLAGSALAAPSLPLAQATNTPPNPAAAVAAFAGCWLIVLFIFLIGLAINIAILVWVARDAKARKMDNVALWVILVIFTGLIGLVVYIIARPKGDLVECPNCHKKRLAGSPGCPHCGAA